ncbi:MAG TPA: replication-relaxation family protein, partial [Solirubrobacteraceae bacterium]
METAENRLVERGTAIRHGLLGLYRRRLERGEGNPLPGVSHAVFAAGELASIWHLPSIDYLTVPFARSSLPLAPAPPGIMRLRDGHGTLRDSLGAVTIEPELRRQNTAVPGAVEQGKSSYLVATVAEDLSREQCAVIVLDPKGDAADAAVSLVEPSRTCTLLDFAKPTCGFNPLAVDAPADVIADYVVSALRNLFSDADIRASSDRYLRNAIIAVLAYDRTSSLWDAARLLSVGEDGYAYRQAVGARVRALPALSEISTFFTSELSAQLADARGVTTAKLDAPVNKLARLLNSSSIKRVLLNDSLRVDFDRVIANGEVLVVKGALGLMGAGNTSVLMQLLVGMLDAALARQQDLLSADQRTAVALKVDEAPLVLNRGFAETIALKRSAGLETVACWQSNAQWSEPEVRDQLDALFAHRVYFATASARDARDAAALMMAEFSDTVRPGIAHLSKLAHPDARLYLPKHHAIASWTTREGRQSPFLARTIPLRVDRERLDAHATNQARRGGRYLADLRQPHWQNHRPGEGSTTEAAAAAGAARRGWSGQSPSRTPSVPRRAARRPVSAASSRSREVGALKHPAPTPGSPCDSYRELIELDLAQSVRWAKPVAAPIALRPDPLDLDMLELTARLRHVLSSQLHRRFNRDRAVTTTQRRLKRLSDAGLVERFQFHRRDGGGVPMCYVISRAGLQLLVDAERLVGHGPSSEHGPGLSNSSESSVDRDGRLARNRDQSRLRQARHDVHVAGLALALAELDQDGRTR